MNNNNMKQLLAILTCIAFSPVTYGWQEHLDKVDWSNFAKDVGYKTALLSSVTTASFAVLINALPVFLKSIPKTKYPKAYKFVCEELEKVGLNPETITIKGVGAYSWSTMSTLFGIYLFFPENDLIEIENLLTEHPDSVLLDRYRFVINHEANHIRHKHVRNKFFATTATLVSIFSLAFSFDYLLDNNPEVLGLPKEQSLLNKITYAQTFGQLLGALTLPLLAYTRVQEQEADDTTQDDIASLNGGIKYFSELEKITDHNPWYAFKNSKFGNFFSTHPSISHRVEVLKERVAQLKAAEE